MRGDVLRTRHPAPHSSDGFFPEDLHWQLRSLLSGMNDVSEEWRFANGWKPGHSGRRTYRLLDLSSRDSQRGANQEVDADVGVNGEARPAARAQLGNLRLCTKRAGHPCATPPLRGLLHRPCDERGEPCARIAPSAVNVHVLAARPSGLDEAIVELVVRDGEVRRDLQHVRATRPERPARRPRRAGASTRQGCPGAAGRAAPRPRSPAGARAAWCRR